MKCVHMCFIIIATGVLILSENAVYGSTTFPPPSKEDGAAFTRTQGHHHHHLRALQHDMKRSLSHLEYDTRSFFVDLKHFVNSKESRTPANINRLAKEGSDLLDSALNALEPFVGRVLESTITGYRSMQTRGFTSLVLSIGKAAINAPLQIPTALAQIPVYMLSCFYSTTRDYYTFFFTSN